jgi:hypothetical protein
MNSMSHSDRNPEYWREDLAHVADLSASVLQRAPEAHDAVELARDAFHYASVVSQFEDRSPEYDTALRVGAVAASTAFALARYRRLGAGGAVLMPARPYAGAAPWVVRKVPIAQAQVTLVDWLDGFALAVLAGDEAAVQMLADPDCLLAAREPAVTIDTFWWPLALALASLARGDMHAAAHLTEAHAQLRQARIVDARFISLRVQPVLVAAEALHSGSVENLEAVLRDGLAAHDAYFAQGDAHDEWRGFLAWTLGAIAARAAGRGLALTLASRTLPRPAHAGVARPALEVEFAERGLLLDDEARWFLDLAGLSRANRQHRIVARGDLLIAHYDIPATTEAPAVHAGFVLADDDLPAPRASVPLALDAGELMLLAEMFAGRDATPASVAEALACVDAALLRLPGGSEAFTGAEFTSELGREAFEREPRRYSRARLRAYREGLAGASVADDPDEDGHEASPEGDSRDQALQVLAVLQAQVTPLLEALSRTGDPQLLAAVKPRDSDFELVFTNPEVAARARAIHAEEWTRHARPQPLRPEFSRLHVHVAPAGMLAFDNELSWHFPRGYRALAPNLNPHRVWVCWKYTRPNETSGGMSYDGLVWCDDHWAWFPKPYRANSAGASEPR